MIYGFFQDEDGSNSMTRLLVFLLVTAFVGLASVVVYKTGNIPDMPMGWAGLISALYLTNKAAPVAQKIWGKPSEEIKP